MEADAQAATGQGRGRRAGPGQGRGGGIGRRTKAEADEREAKPGSKRNSRRPPRLCARMLLGAIQPNLDTRDTQRGLVINMADVLFDTGSSTSAAIAREKLARLAGIVLAHPGLKARHEGHTDSTGSDELEPEALGPARGFGSEILMEQGMPETSFDPGRWGSASRCRWPTIARGGGPAQNRRVEIIVSGEGHRQQRSAGQ